jgi:hypothetical protein
MEQFLRLQSADRLAELPDDDKRALEDIHFKAIESSRDAIIVINEDGKIVVLN